MARPQTSNQHKFVSILKKDKRPYRYIHWRVGDQGEKIPYIPCTDGAFHRYLNADYTDLEENPPRAPTKADQPDERRAACPSCGCAMAELRGTIIRPCSECAWDQIAEHIQEFEAESGIKLMPSSPDQVELRKKCPQIEKLARQFIKGSKVR